MKKFLIVFSLVFLTACTGNLTDNLSNKVDCNEMKDLVEEEAILIDVRTKEEYADGHLEGSINMDSTTIMNDIETKIPDKDTKIVVYCRSGNRSSSTLKKLKEKGYTNVYDLGSISNC